MAAHLYNRAADKHIAEIPHGISARTVADYFGVTVERVEKARRTSYIVTGGNRESRREIGTAISGDGARTAFAAMAADGSRRLLQAQLRTGQHFIRNPQLLALAKHAAGLA